MINKTTDEAYKRGLTECMIIIEDIHKNELAKMSSYDACEYIWQKIHFIKHGYIEGENHHHGDE